MSTAEAASLKHQQNLNEVLYAWKSPSHPFKKRNRMFYQTVAAFTFLLVVIVFFLHEFLLIGVILALTFVIYAISTVPPVEVTHKITPIGFDNAGRLFHWQELYSFWFEEQWGQKILVIHTRIPFPTQIRAVLHEATEEKLQDILGKYLLYLEKPPKSWSDQASRWLVKKFPIDTTI